MKRKKENKKSKNIFYKVLSILLILVSIIFLGILFYMDLLPSKYMVALTISILLFNLINVLLLNLKRLKKKIKKFLSIIVIIIIILLSLANFYICRTFSVLSNNGDSKYKLAHYSVMVLKDEKYSDIEDLNGKALGYYQNTLGLEEAEGHLNKKGDFDFESYESTDILASDLNDKKIDAILIEDSIKQIMQEESQETLDELKTLYEFTVKVEIKSTAKDVDVTKEAFAIYISGIDTYGEISSVSRSDVNIIMVVNPKTKQVLLISIPRDYYVQLHGTTGTKDKLTHAGIYGVDMSIKTIEDLLELDINYYIKVNFTSVIDIVDALGGLDVYSKYSFISYSGFGFKKGYNSVNGEQALDFVRTRKAFADGDRQRGKNQQALIEAIIRKATSKSIITKYNSLLSAIDGKYQTNMSTKKITSLIKKQLEDMSSWNITSYSLAGKDSSNYTYTYNQLLYVMEPNEESVNEAIELIDKVLEGEMLDSSYDSTVGTSNKVTQVKTQTSTSTTQNQEDNKSSEMNNGELFNSEKNEEDIDSENKDDVDDIIVPGDDSEKDADDNTDNDNEESQDDNEDPLTPIIPDIQN